MGERRSRRDLLAAAGAAALVAGCGTAAPPATEPRRRQDVATGDRDILAFALTLEYFEADFYERLVREKLLSGRDQELAKSLGENEAEHVDALETTLKKLGGKLPERPRPNFAKLLDGNPEAIVQRAAEIEDLGASAYLGQASRIQDKEILASALAIHAVEARHAAVLNLRVGQAFVPDGALAVPRERRDVLERVAGFLL